MNLGSALGNVAEIIPGRLLFTSLCMHPESDDTTQYLTIDNDLIYAPFFADFGPLNLGMLVTFCRSLDSHLEAAKKTNKEIIFYSLHDGHKRANAGFLISCYSVLSLKRSPMEAWRPLAKLYPPFLPFRDASYGVSTYNLTIPDCLSAVHKAMLLNWIDIKTFDQKSYEFYEQVQNGDWNWIVPKRLAAMSGPGNTPKVDDMNNVIAIGAPDYVPIFREHQIRHVVRLNDREYDKRIFTRAGILHLELQFPDGGTPTDAVLKKFLEYAESHNDAIIIHCKAGLGRTGTLIAAYIMKHYAFTAREAIAWCRICRPGSVIGPQQQYLERIEGRLLKAGIQKREESKTNLPFGAPLPSVSHTPGKPTPPSKHTPSPTRGLGTSAAMFGTSWVAVNTLLERHQQEASYSERHALSGTSFRRTMGSDHSSKKDNTNSRSVKTAGATFGRNLRKDEEGLITNSAKDNSSPYSSKFSRPFRDLVEYRPSGTGVNPFGTLPPLNSE
eukprot:PhF_6_TR19989/c0_g1_i1/m.29165/K06639/CDC14; cell division cycle 14